MIKIEKAGSAGYVLKIDNKRITLDGDALEKLRLEAQKMHFEPAMLKALEIHGFDVKKIESDEALMEALMESLCDISEKEMDASEIMYELEREYRDYLENYRITERRAGRHGNKR